LPTSNKDGEFIDKLGKQAHSAELGKTTVVTVTQSNEGICV
jgi:hypothetical protein